MRGSDAPPVPTGIRLVMLDVFANPDSSITEITARTGLRQSHVSVAVADLREKGILETKADPDDGRRTMVRVCAETPGRVARAGAVSADDALAAALDEHDSAPLATIVKQLESLAKQLQATSLGPMGRELEALRTTGTT